MNPTTPDSPPATRPWVVRTVQAGLAALGIAGVVWMAVSPPGIFSDSVSGFLVLRSMEHGAAFNQTLSVDPDDIAHDRSEFTSWWTPGQWIVVWPFTATGLSLGTGITIATALAWAAGILGWWTLFRRLDFDDTVTSVSVALVAIQPWVIGWALFYHGGAILQWAVFPWFGALALRGRAFRWIDVLLLSAALVVGIMAKSSFLIVGVAALAGALATGLLEPGAPRGAPAVARVMRSALVVAAGLAALYAYSALGRSPAGTRPWRLVDVATHEVLFALAAPLNSVFDLWRLYIPPSESVQWVLGDIRTGLVVTLLLEGLVLGLVLRLGRDLRRYTIFATVVVVLVAGAYAVAYSLDLLISFHVRHARVAGLLLVPGVVAAVARLEPRGLRVAVATASLASCAGMTVWSLGSLGFDPLARPVGPAGFSHVYAGQDVVDAIAEIDTRLAGRDALIAVPWPQLGLEVRHVRLFDTRAALEGPEEFRHELYYGRVDDLVVIAPAPNGESAFAEVIAHSFREHDGWRRIRPELEGYVFLYSGDATDLE